MVQQGPGRRTLDLVMRTKHFRESGYLLIGKEILKYTGISGGAFTGIKRGVLGSPIADHADDSKGFVSRHPHPDREIGEPV